MQRARMKDGSTGFRVKGEKYQGLSGVWGLHRELMKNDQ